MHTHTEHILYIYTNEQVIKIKPPMVFSAENADTLVDTLDTLLAQVRACSSPSTCCTQSHTCYMCVRASDRVAAKRGPLPTRNNFLTALSTHRSHLTPS